MGSRAAIDVNSVILSKCHSGESLFEYYLQEFQYGNGIASTTTIQFGGYKNRPSIREK